MFLNQDSENVQSDTIKNRKTLYIAGAIAVTVILMAACGAVYFTNKSSQVDVEASGITNSHHVSRGAGARSRGGDVAGSVNEDGPGHGVGIEVEPRTGAEPASETVNEAVAPSGTVNGAEPASKTVNEAVAPSGTVNGAEPASETVNEAVAPSRTVNGAEPASETVNEAVAASGTVNGAAPAPDIYSQGQVFVVVSRNNRRQVLLFNSETKAEVPFTGQDQSEQPCYNVKVSPNGEVIGLLSLKKSKTELLNFMECSFRLYGRDGKFWRELDLPQLNNGNTDFSFTPDSERIIYTTITGTQIHSVDLNGENPQILLNLSSVPQRSNSKIKFPFFLENGALVYSIKIGSEYKVCMKKTGAQESCWVSKFGILKKIIPFGQFVYCVGFYGNVLRIDTSEDTDTELKSFTIDGILWYMSDELISENGEFLYLFAQMKGENGVLIFKVNIEDALRTGTYQIEDPMPSSSFTVPPFIALVPTLR